VRNLNSNVETIITIPRLEEMVTNKYETVKNKYCRPVSKTFVGIDSWICGLGFFNMTVNQEHKLKISQFVKLLTTVVCECGQVPPLYWIVPAGAEFANYRRKSWSGDVDEYEYDDHHRMPGKSARPKKKISPSSDDLALCEGVVQFALELEIS